MAYDTPQQMARNGQLDRSEEQDSTAEDDEVWQMVGKPLEVFGLKDI